MTGKRYAALLLSAVLVLSALGTPKMLNISAETVSDTAEVSGEVYADNTYYEFLNKHKDAAFASTEIKAEIGVNLSSQSFQTEITAPASGLYTFGMSYKSLDSEFGDYTVSLKIDGEYQYASMEELSFPQMYTDAEEIRVDATGNQFAPEQVKYSDYYLNYAYDSVSVADGRYFVWLSEGKHTVELSLSNGEIAVEYFLFDKPDNAEKYTAPDSSDYYKGESIILEGEQAFLKSNHFLASKADNSTTAVTPYNAKSSVVNYVGGGNWKKAGDTIIWETPYIEKGGYFKLGFSYRQNGVIGGKTYRTLRIDGEIPFADAENIGFAYNDTWQQSVFADKDGEPYLIYLSEGKHQISLTVTSGEMAEVSSQLAYAVSELGSLYLDMNMITGETVDIYRNYELFKQIPDMEQRLNDIKSALNGAADMLVEVTGSDSGSNYAVIKNMVEVINQMLASKFEAHRYKKYYYTNYCSVSSVYQELKSMPLELDKMVLTSADAEKVFEKVSFFKSIWFSVERFFVSFAKDYKNVSVNDGEKEAVTIWVNWGRDQAQVLSSLTQRTFTAETGIPVNIQLVNASIVQATLSGKGPDCILQHSRSEPVNLAMRGLLYDLSSFDDCDEVLKRFQDGAATPYMYKNGLYALPDTQTFFMMFIRTDIFEKLNLEIPETWADFNEVSKLLARHNMNVWMQVNTVMDAATNGGVGSINLFPSLLLQNNLSLYEDDGKKTTLTNADVMEVFGNWADYYSKMKFPKTMDFYNRFRTGTTPMGICSYTMYTTLKVAAPEINGLWTIAPIPGTENADGTVSHASSGGGTGCAIMKSSKNPELAWEFLKWWTSDETQMLYSNEVESILGPAGRIALSNVNALQSLDWDKGFSEQLMSAWSEVEEIPEYPGSYYLSRSIYQSFWNVVEKNENSKDMLLKYGKEADDEIARKWQQYTNR